MLANVLHIRVFSQVMTNIDKINTRILHELQINGRISNSELADKVGLSASACLRRVQELERTGVIKGYRAILDSAELGIGFTAYIAVGLSDHTSKSQLAFEKAITQSAAVRECHNITGSVEYLLRVETQDLAAYKTFHLETLGILPQVNSIETFVVMDSSKDERA